MKLRPLFLTALALATLAFGVTTAKSTASPVVVGMTEAQPHTLRVLCPKPSTLRLIRFEDGSAQLKCAKRVLVRVSVPG